VRQGRDNGEIPALVAQSTGWLRTQHHQAAVDGGQLAGDEVRAVA
jgi:hypothetical protein